MASKLGKYVAGFAITGSIAAGASGVMALTGVPSASAPAVSFVSQIASAPSCSWSRSQSHTVTSRGTQTWTEIQKRTCGRNYQKWEHRVTDSFTGATSDAHTYRNEYANPHFWQQVVTVSRSARGTHSYRVTITQG